jgi:large subunit ribosomal protein L30
MAEKTTGEKKPTAKKPAAARKPAARNLAVKKAASASKAAAAPVKAPGGKPEKRVKVTLVRSVIGTRKSHRATVLGLGLKRRHQTVELEDTPSVRGMINKVNYLLKVEA